MGFYHSGIRSRLRKFVPANLARSLALARSEETLLLDWVNRGPVRENWGDAIAPLIAGRLSGRTVVNNRDTVNLRHRTLYTSIGSMLATIDVDGFEAWGTGFVDSRGTLRARPAAIHAVRGPLTAQKLREQGVSCPDLFGDPASLFPRLYQPVISKEFDLGIIPHFKEAKLPAVERLRREGVRILDIRGPGNSVVDEMNRCSRIASSSLHGLVAADAYGLPAIWVRFSDMPGGDGFKFRDYLASTNTRQGEPLYIVETTTIAEIDDQFALEPPELNTDGLLDACPFLDPSRVRPNGTIE